MRGEHKTNGLEHDAFSGWRRHLIYVQRPGHRRWVKRYSHKRDRQVGKLRVQEGLADHEN